MGRSGIVVDRAVVDDVKPSRFGSCVVALLTRIVMAFWPKNNTAGATFSGATS
jgi:hypothetical protein